MKARKRTKNRRILTEMLSLPTAPFAEHAMAAYVERFCVARSALKLTRDRAGNLLIHLRQGGRRVARPVCLTAHLDHPGFICDRMVSKKRVRAWWRGGVAKEYFVGSRVRFHVDGSWIQGRVVSTKMAPKRAARLGPERVDTVVAEVEDEVPPQTVGMWDFPDPTVRGTRIYARGCDDLAGAAAILAALDVLVRRRTPCEAYFLFTRAEEVGFIGAIAAARAGTVPKRCFVVNMETSSRRANAKLGDGPILRVGDKSTTFHHAVTAYCHQVARELAAKDKSFQFQRRLMDGGTCESSAFCAFGYEATGLCVALGNYHNMDIARKRIGPEYIDLRDWDNVVKWFVALASSKKPYTGWDEGFARQLIDLEKTYHRLLMRSRNARA